jgi:hypothetical protein
VVSNFSLTLTQRCHIFFDLSKKMAEAAVIPGLCDKRVSTSKFKSRAADMPG